MKRIIGTLTIVLGMAAGTALAYPTAESINNTQAGSQSVQTEQMKLEQTPQPVQATITQHLQGGDIKNIQRVTENSGQAFYEVSLKNTEGNMEYFRVDPNGQYLGKDINGDKWFNQNTTDQDNNTGGLRPRQDER
jgi:hypothetical protein